MKNNIKKFLGHAITFALAFALAVSFSFVNADAAAKPKLSKSKVTIKVGASTTLKVKNVSKTTKVTWSSSNKKIATVNSKGKIVGKSAGTAKITAKVKGKKYTCKVTVKCTSHKWKQTNKKWIDEKGHYEEVEVPSLTYVWVGVGRIECDGCHESFYSDDEFMDHSNANKKASWDKYGYINKEEFPCALASSMVYDEGHYEKKTTYEKENQWVVDEEGHFEISYKCKTCTKTKMVKSTK